VYSRAVNFCPVKNLLRGSLASKQVG